MRIHSTTASGSCAGSFPSLHLIFISQRLTVGDTRRCRALIAAKPPAATQACDASEPFGHPGNCDAPQDRPPRPPPHPPLANAIIDHLTLLSCFCHHLVPPLFYVQLPSKLLANISPSAKSAGTDSTNTSHRHAPIFSLSVLQTSLVVHPGLLASSSALRPFVSPLPDRSLLWLQFSTATLHRSVFCPSWAIARLSLLTRVTSKTGASWGYHRCLYLIMRRSAICFWLVDGQ